MSIEIRDKSPKTFIVLGAPSSATSLVSKALEAQGVEMHNSQSPRWKRFYEDRRFRMLNQRILRAAGGDDTHLPSEKAIMAVDCEDEMRKIINSRKGKMWGWKGPRNSLTLKKYLPLLDDDVYLICCFRTPPKVLRSWQRSGKPKGVDRRKFLDHYNNSIISIIKEFCGL